MILSEEQVLIRDTARAFARERLAPGAEKRDRDHAFPAAELAEMGELGFLGMVVPPDHDGAGTDYVSYALALMEIAWAEGATSTIMSVHNSVGCMPILTFGSAAQKQTYLRPMARGESLGCFCLTEPEAGSDAAAIKTRAVKDGQSYVLTGTKQLLASRRKAK